MSDSLKLATAAISKGTFERGGRLPIVTMAETLKVERDALAGVAILKYNGTVTECPYDFAAETVTLAKGSPVRVLRTIAGLDIAYVLPGDIGTRVNARTGPEFDAVIVPLSALKS